MLGCIGERLTGGGLNRFNTATRRFRRYTMATSNIASDAVLGAAVDTTGAVWAATWAGGLNLLDLKRDSQIRDILVSRRHKKPGVAAHPGLAEEIRAFVGERLAWYQAPREIVFVEELPLTATGKIIRRDLRGR